MELSDNVQDHKGVSSIIMPQGMNLREKICYWTVQANACMLPFSLLYAIGGDNPKAGVIAAGINAVLAYTGAIALRRSYNRRHGKNAMTVDWSPSVSFAGRDYRVIGTARNS